VPVRVAVPARRAPVRGVPSLRPHRPDAVWPAGHAAAQTGCV